jgi:hypothetical protein
VLKVLARAEPSKTWNKPARTSIHYFRYALFSGQINRCSCLDISSGKKFYNFVPEKKKKERKQEIV